MGSLAVPPVRWEKPFRRKLTGGEKKKCETASVTGRNERTSLCFQSPFSK